MIANLVSSRECPLSLLNLPPQLLDSPHVLPQVLALLLLVQLDEVVHNPLVEVFTSKMSVSCRNRISELIIRKHSCGSFLYHPNMPAQSII